MSDTLSRQAWESIYENLPKHIDRYFMEDGTEERDIELLNYIMEDRILWGIVKDTIANDTGNNLRSKIAELAYNNQPEAEYESGDS